MTKKKLAGAPDPFSVAMENYHRARDALVRLDELADKLAYKRRCDEHIAALRRMERAVPKSHAGLVASLETFIAEEGDDLAEGQVRWLGNMLKAARALLKSGRAR